MQARKRQRGEEEEEEVVESKVKPNFGLSGLLAADKRTGNKTTTTTDEDNKPRVLVSKYSPPADAMEPSGDWRLFVFPPPGNKDQTDQTLYLHRKPYFVFGKQTELVDFDLEEDEDSINEPSLSPEHAVLQYRKQKDKLYLLDLESTHGTRLNGERIVPARYVELLDGDVITFGNSQREFVLKQPK